LCPVFLTLWFGKLDLAGLRAELAAAEELLNTVLRNEWRMCWTLCPAQQRRTQPPTARRWNTSTR
jgi:hypothetical protein